MCPLGVIASTFPLHGWLGGRAASAFATRAPVPFRAERSAAPAVGDSRCFWKPAACCPGCGVSGNVASESVHTGYGIMELMYGRHECGASWTSTRVSQGVGCAGLMIVWLHQGRRDAQQIASESDVVPNCQGAFSIGKSRETEVGRAAEASVVVQMQPNSAARVPHGGGHARAGRPSAVMCRNCRLRQKEGLKTVPKYGPMFGTVCHMYG